MTEQVLPIVIAVAIGFVVVLGVLAMVARFYKQVEQGRALSVKTIDIDRRGKEGLICNDNIRADINVTFFVRVNKTRDDVLKVAQSLGCQRASDANALEELFTAKF